MNNQVAFTTTIPSTLASSVLHGRGQGVNAPVFHVNGDDVEAVARVMELATEWSQSWKTDVVVDIVCYRKYGHNEIDEPMFTQPLMYKKIKQQMSAHEQYCDKLVAEGTMTREEIAAVRESDVVDARSRRSRTRRITGPSPGTGLPRTGRGSRAPISSPRSSRRA